MSDCEVHFALLPPWPVDNESGEVQHEQRRLHVRREERFTETKYV